MDPDGRWIESLWDVVNVAMGVENFVSNIHEGNVSDALVDGVGIALDAIATILPVVPGGASTTIKPLSDGLYIYCGKMESMCRLMKMYGISLIEVAKIKLFIIAVR